MTKHLCPHDHRECRVPRCAVCPEGLASGSVAPEPKCAACGLPASREHHCDRWNCPGLRIIGERPAWLYDPDDFPGFTDAQIRAGLTVRAI